MGLNYLNLDDRTRHLAESEVDFDVQRGDLYLGSRLSDQGRLSYQGLLREALRNGTDDTLAAALHAPGVLVTHEMSHRKGVPYEKRVPVNAAETLAEGEFNRFYLRGLCLRCIEDGIDSVVVYRAKAVANPRPESEALVGQHLDARQLLEDLRTHTGVDTALGLPPGPNSGLSARLP